MCNLLLSVAFSAHFGMQGNYNQVHPSIRCEGEKFTTGLFLNSEDSVSVFAAYRMKSNKTWLEVGVVTGYSDADVMPFLRAGFDLNDHASLFVAPAIETWNDETNVGLVIGLDLKI